MANNFYQQGSHGTDTFTGAEIKGFWSYGASSTVSSIRLSSGSASATAGYQVTAGKTLYITKMIINGGSTTTTDITIGYGDTDVGFSSGSDPTNWKSVAGNNHIGSFSLRQTPFSTAVADAMATVNCLLAIPASKYTTISYANSNAAVYLEGFEI